MKRMIDPISCAGQILPALKKGVLLTAKEGDKVNPMTIGWGMIGIEWSKPVFIGLVRGNRYTKPMLDRTGEFTVNIPVGEADPQIIRFCGTKSGRDFDKIAELGLTLEEPEVISVPGIRELPLTLECRIIYTQLQTPESIVDGHLNRHYPQQSESIEQDYHTAYYAEIVSAYIIE